MLDFFVNKMRETPEHQAAVSDDFSANYGILLDLYERYCDWLHQQNIPAVSYTH